MDYLKLHDILKCLVDFWIGISSSSKYVLIKVWNLSRATEMLSYDWTCWSRLMLTLFRTWSKPRLLILVYFISAAMDPTRAVQAVLSNSVSVSSTLNGGEPSSSSAITSSSLPIDNFLKPDRKLFTGNHVKSCIVCSYFWPSSLFVRMQLECNLRQVFEFPGWLEQCLLNVKF